MKINKSLLLSSIAIMAALATASANAILISGSGTTYDVEVQLNLAETATGVNMSWAVDSTNTGNTGDLRGLFFDVSLPDPTVISITGPDVTSVLYDSEGAGDWSIGPLGAFSVAIEIGTSGMGMDFIQLTSTTADPLRIADLTGRFGVRLTSLGPVGGPYPDSAKIQCVDCPPPPPPPNGVPEPGSLALLGAGLLGLGLIRRRRAA